MTKACAANKRASETHDEALHIQEYDRACASEKRATKHEDKNMIEHMLLNSETRDETLRRQEHVLPKEPQKQTTKVRNRECTTASETKEMLQRNRPF